jgi:hypothetical protein
MSKENNKGLNTVDWGKMGRGGKEPSLSPSIGHKQRTLSFSFHWPPRKEPFPSLSFGHQALDMPSPSFAFFLKGGLGSLELFFFPGHNFQFNLENTCSHKFLEEEKND